MNPCDFVAEIDDAYECSTVRPGKKKGSFPLEILDLNAL